MEWLYLVCIEIPEVSNIQIKSGGRSLGALLEYKVCLLLAKHLTEKFTIRHSLELAIWCMPRIWHIIDFHQFQL